jgi:hypothetical protein
VNITPGAQFVFDAYSADAVDVKSAIGHLGILVTKSGAGVEEVNRAGRAWIFSGLTSNFTRSGFGVDLKSYIWAPGVPFPPVDFLPATFDMQANVEYKVVMSIDQEIHYVNEKGPKLNTLFTCNIPYVFMNTP